MNRLNVGSGMVVALLLLHGSVPSGAQEVRKIQDNSFLREEA